MKLLIRSFAVVAASLIALSAQAGSAELSTFTDFAKAQEASVAQKKPILVDFTGSTWCPPCKMMQRDTLSKEAFISFANENVIFLKVDFPTPDFEGPGVSPSSRKLVERFEVNVVPTYLLLSPEGKVIGRQEGGLPGGPDAFIAWIKKSL